ncbi:hypothetical protein PMKS-003196 [Pichia membranifaciens]|uniref:Uncharacterized protein n=1 Tax=Pichia membranifaciens TaxID=4926 RepID=A0A1Q2YJH2_9ASCO|nr:hypothetical protein PMKS-003196 [Pichia membranifaciens]
MENLVAVTDHVEIHDDEAVANWNQSREGEGDKSGGSDGSPLWGAEIWMPCDQERDDPDDRSDRDEDVFQSGLINERVVDDANQRGSNQEQYASIVQTRAHRGHLVGMNLQHMECC